MEQRRRNDETGKYIHFWNEIERLRVREER